MTPEAGSPLPANRNLSASEERSLPYWELLFREIIAIEALAVVLVCIALIWDAPLEQLADPLHTPNPAKAPWYFSGLQELLHYFPPLVAGIILPTLVVVALIIIPFFKVNIKDESLWAHHKQGRLQVLGVLVLILSAGLVRAHAWDALLPVWIVSLFMFLAASNKPDAETRGFQAWLHYKPLSFWIMTWFLMEAAVLTAVGTLFRGPGWVWVWPWRG